MIENFDTVIFTLMFIVPGFIIKSVNNLFYNNSSHNETNTILECFTYSCINSSITYGFIYVLLIKSGKYSTLSDGILILLFLLFLFIIPVILGLALIYIKQKNIIRNILSFIGINTLHPLPTAWDYFFSIIEEEAYLIVTLNDNSEIYGLFSCKSFASSNIDNQDLYLQEVYNLKSDGMWEKIDGTSILIRQENIKYIERI